MDYLRILSKIKESPWLITEESLQMILDIVERRITGSQLSDEEIKTRLATARAGNTHRGQMESGGGIGVLPLTGPIFPRANMMTEMSGATSLAQFRNDFRELMANDLVGTIVLDVDSPGGISDMVPEMAQEIREARETKNIYAVANVQAGSAAYYLASQASQVYVTPSGAVGSIGVYTVHTDRSGQEAQDGIKTTYISAGRYKTEGAPNAPLSEEGRAYRQKVVDDLYESFVTDVAAGRDVPVQKVLADYGQGRMLGAKDALDAGMVDAVASLDEVLGSLLQGTQVRTSQTALASARAFAAAKGDRPRSEVVEWEHSEPGTGPEPRETPVEKDAAEGYRRDTPDDFKEGKPDPNANSIEEGSNMHDQLVAMCGALGITVPDDATDEQLLSLIEAEQATLVAEVTPLREAAANAGRTQTFREQFPDEYAQLQSSLQRDKEMDAKEFASDFERFKTKEGEATKFGFSARVLTNIEDTHLALSEGNLTSDDLRNLLTAISDNGIVEFGERGSARHEGDRHTRTDTPGKLAFAERVEEVMTADSVPYSAAVKLAAERYPEEFAEYRAQVPTRRQ